MSWQLHIRVLSSAVLETLEGLMRDRTGSRLDRRDGLLCTFDDRPDPAFIDALGTWMFNLGARDARVRSRQGNGAWHTGFRAIVTAAAITDDTWVRPPWEPAPEGPARCVIIEPGLSFGTGTHATTRAALQLVERSVRPGDSVLDVGCGSGVLGIAAALMGATAAGVEIDPGAVEQARANAALNDVADVTTWTAEPLDTVLGAFDLVVANMFLGVLEKLAEPIMQRCRRDLVLSGLLESEEARVRSAYAELRVAGRATRDGWLALHLTRVDTSR